MTNESEREAFDEWWYRMMHDMFDYGPHEERYTDQDEELAWEVWQARAALDQRQEVTDEMLERVWNAMGQQNPTKKWLRSALEINFQEISQAPVYISDAVVSRACDVFKKRSLECGYSEKESDSSSRAMRAALQSIAQPVKSISEALNFLEEWALSGGKLEGDDIQRVRATVERIAPIESPVKVPDGWKIRREESDIFPVRIEAPDGRVWYPECSQASARLALAMLAAAPEYKP